MLPDYPKRLIRYYAAHLLWLVEYGTPADLAAFPPSVQAWVREVRAVVPVATPSFRRMSAPATCDLLATLIQERNPLL